MNQRVFWVATLLVLGCSKASAEKPPLESVPLPVSPDEVARRFQLSYDAEATGHLAEALAALDPAPATGASAYVAALRSGWLLYQLGRHNDAVVAYKKAATLAPQSIEAKNGLLGPLAALGRWVDVERVARDILGRDSANATALIKLAFALYNQGKYADAATTYAVVVANYPSDVDARAGLGWSQLKQGQRADANVTFAQVLEIAPHNALAADGTRTAAQGAEARLTPGTRALPASP